MQKQPLSMGFVWAKECCPGLFQHFNFDFRGEFCNSKHSSEDSQKSRVPKFSEKAPVSATLFSFGLLRRIQNFHQFLSAFRIHCFCQRRKMHSTARLLHGVTLIFERGQIWPLLKLHDFGISISLLPPRAQRPYHSAKKAYHSGAREGQKKKGLFLLPPALNILYHKERNQGGGDTISFSLCRIRPVMALLEDPFGSVLYCYETL